MKIHIHRVWCAGSAPVRRRRLCRCLSTPLRSPRIPHLWVVFLCVTRSNTYYTPEIGVRLITVMKSEHPVVLYR
ncbi:hypothetical protein SKAU_G00272330 [Synaphobranchus kaupii]|uniref:Uncharacterized protein n=1 Tax=Synaphobranchus kaupii TaxID=118154 RepID=A0A9Q1IQP7_SYNKA|nr:hypothetical protein SKAU_G00272330 [Synaphobranchus kaupii]